MKIKELLQNSLAIYIGLTFTVVSYWNLLHVKFWMLDDHKIVYWNSISEQNLLLKWKIWLNDTNFFRHGENLRFFPSYDFIKVIQTELFGDRPAHWFIFNIIAIISIYLLATYFILELAKRLEVGHSPLLYWFASLLSLGLVSNPTTASIYSRLGTSESLALPLMILSLLIFAKMVNKSINIINVVNFSIATMILSGVKEIYLVGGLIGLVVNLFYYRKTRRNLLLVLAVLQVVWIMYVLTGFLGPLLRADSDLYGNSVSIYDTLMKSLQSLVDIHCLIICVQTLLIFTLLRYSNLKSNLLIKNLTITNTVFFLCNLLYFRGMIMDRYLTNFIFIIWLNCSILILMFLSSSSKTPRTSSLKYAISFILVTFLVNSFPSVTTTINNQQRATSSFALGIDEIVQSPISTIGGGVIFVVQSGWDYESVLSVSRFIKSRNSGIKFYTLLRTNEKNSLTNILEVISKTGSEEWKVLPISKIDGKSRYLCVYSQSKLILDSPTLCSVEKIIEWLP